MAGCPARFPATGPGRAGGSRQPAVIVVAHLERPDNAIQPDDAAVRRAVDKFAQHFVPFELARLDPHTGRQLDVDVEPSGGIGPGRFRRERRDVEDGKRHAEGGWRASCRGGAPEDCERRGAAGVLVVLMRKAFWKAGRLGPGGRAAQASGGGRRNG